MSEVTTPRSLVSFATSKHCTLLGELHGTNEFPEALLRLVYECAKYTDRQIALQLELPRELTEHVINYVAGHNLLPIHKFASNISDGTFSTAIQDMLLGFRPLMEQDRLKILCFDGYRGSSQQSGEEVLAFNILDGLKTYKDCIHLVLCGNIHASIDRVDRQSFGFKTAGTILNQLTPSLQSLYLASTGGFTHCVQKDTDGEFRAKELLVTNTAFKAMKGGEFVLLDDEFDFDAEWNVGAVTGVNKRRRAP
jgi:hypothetical protein